MRLAPSVVVFAGTLLAAGMTGLAAGADHARAEMAAQIEDAGVNTHPSQGDVKPVEGGKARLMRTPDGIFVNLETGGLTAGHVYTLLLAVINDPANCEGSPCKPADVLGRTAETKADIVGVADGVIVGADGKARFASFQPAGDLPNAWLGNGLQNPEGAEIHLVVNDHGPLVPELGPAMTNTYRGGCADDSVPAAFPAAAKADGTPGDNTCRLVQVAIFVPAGM